MEKPVLSIGIIFRDDIRCIERCLTALEPLRKAVPCQLVMADTGSVDGSRAVAERFADILIDFPWINDFSAARNAVIDRSTGHWFLSVDTDEYLDEDISELVYFLTHKKKQTHDYCGIVIRNYSTYEMDGDYSDFIAIRMARMSIGPHYKGNIHERWANLPETLTIVPLKRTIFRHDGYVGLNSEAGKAKRERNLTLIREKLKQAPEDLMTWLQLIECSVMEDDFLDNLRHGVEMVQQGVRAAPRLGPPIMRYAVMHGELLGLPELEEWLQWTDEHFPNSLYTRLDAAYYAVIHYHNKKDFRQCIAYGKKYLEAQSDYRAGKADQTAQVYSVLKTASPQWERDMKLILSNAYCQEEQYECAFEVLRTIENYTDFDAKQTTNLLVTLKEIHRHSTLDTAPAIMMAWQELSRPEPDRARADARIKAFFEAGTQMFKPETRRLDEGWTDVFRPSYTLFAPLDGECGLGTAAVIWAETDPQVLTRKLLEVNWELTPIHILAHALDCGAVFPHPEKPLNVEDMDGLAFRLARDDMTHMPALIHNAAADKDPQALAWRRGLAMAAVKTVRWDDEKLDEAMAMDLARQFALAEKEFLPVCYSVQTLNEDGLFILPPMHRFGWYCAQAFDALDSGDAVNCVRLLHSGLDVCGNMKHMVKFLLNRVKEMKQASRIADAPPELLELAKKVQLILARFAPDDPAVSALKQSEAYQKVAWIIEKPASVFETVLQ